MSKKLSKEQLTEMTEGTGFDLSGFDGDFSDLLSFLQRNSNYYFERVKLLAEKGHKILNDCANARGQYDEIEKLIAVLKRKHLKVIK